MKTQQIRTWRSRLEWKVTFLMFTVILTAFTSTAEAIYSLPASRSITWTGNVGVTNDIPYRATVYRTLSPVSGDNSAAIQTAITNCPAGQVVQLNPGTFSISNAITLKSGVTLRGAGMGKTIIKGASGMTGRYVVGITNGSSSGTSVSITAGMGKGSTTITTGSAHGYSVGDIILIDQLNNPQGDPRVTNVGNNGTCTWCGRASGARSLGQLSKVVAVPSSTTATLEVPLYWNYTSGLSPQATKLTGIVKDAGIEDLTIDNSLSGSSSQTGDGGTILFRGTSNCWMLRVEAIGVKESMLRVFSGYRNTVRSCKFHEGVPALPINGSQYSSAYGVKFSPYASANLFENNQFYHLRAPFMIVGAVSGNVIAYNYMTDLYSDSGSYNFQLSAISTHGGHPMMNLIEGNYTQGRLRGDEVWGSASHNTFFRNRTVLQPNRTSGTYDVDLHKDNTYFNLIGNVIGTPGVENTCTLNNVNISGQKAIYRLGYNSDGDLSASSNDPFVSSTLLLHGNWDSATNSVAWNGSNDRSLPASLYLTGKPSWWGSIQWPAIGPDVSPMSPATVTAGNGTPWDSKTLLNPPTNLAAR